MSLPTEPTISDLSPKRVSLQGQGNRVICIAHRGASAYAPENSLEAFQKAAEMHADMVEIDVRVTADSVPVIAHDDNLKRLFGVERRIADLSLAELRNLTPEGRDPIPTFEEVAAMCASLGLGLYLDIKDWDRSGPPQ